jgi:hypothetical protein
MELIKDIFFCYIPHLSQSAIATLGLRQAKQVYTFLFQAVKIIFHTIFQYLPSSSVWSNRKYKRKRMCNSGGSSLCVCVFVVVVEAMWTFIFGVVSGFATY